MIMTIQTNWQWNRFGTYMSVWLTAESFVMDDDG